MANLYTPPYRSEIDGLRAVLMIIVIFYHSFSEYAVRGSYLSIDVFFVISGYLMTKIIVRSLENESFSFRTFLRRRILRIFPVLFLVQLFSLIIGCLFYYRIDLSILLKEVTAGSFLLANWQLMEDEFNLYNLSLHFRPLVHMWTLAIEEQFYLLIPFVLWTGWKLGWNLKILLGVLTAISLGICAFYHLQYPHLVFYSTEARIWEILAGGVISFYPVSVRRRELFALSGLSIIVLGLLFSSQDQEIIAIIGAILLLSADSGAWIHRKIFSQPLLVKFGLMSYSIYMWHWPILALPRIINGEPLSAIVRCILIVCVLVIGTLTWKYFEVPLRKNGRAWVWLMLLFSLGLTSYFIQKNDLFGKVNLSDSDEGSISHFRDCAIDPEMKKIGQVICQSSLKENTDYLLVGDSHALDKFHGLNLKDKQHSWRAVVITNCAPVMGIRDNKNQQCEKSFEKIFQWVAHQNEVRTVIISFFSTHYIFQRRFSKTDFLQGLRNTVSFLQNSGKEVIILNDVPFFPASRNDCYRKNHCLLPEELVSAGQTAHRSMLADLRKEFPTLRIFDSFPVFCENKKCSLKQGNFFLYQDRHRLNRKGSEVYAEAFLKEMGL